MLGELIEQSEQELAYLESVIDSVNRADGYTELAEIRHELYEQGYLKRAKNDKSKKSKPMPRGIRSTAMGEATVARMELSGATSFRFHP